MFKNKVFMVALLLSLAFIVVGTMFKDGLMNTATSILNFIITYFGWFYLSTGSLFVIVCLYLMFSKYGKIKLGDPTDQPAYGTKTWLAMLFSTGMGVGLVFWSIAEPVMHYMNNPFTEPGSDESAEFALQNTFFHWGIHPWAIFGLVGLGMAYFQFRKKLPALVSSIFYPILGDRIYGPIGKTIDTYSIFVTTLGVASTLGLSSLQIAGGFNVVWGIPNTLTLQITIISFATIIFVISSITGINRGIKILSNINMVIAVGLMLMLLLIGPMTTILSLFVSTTASYLNDMISLSFRLTPFSEDKQSWITNWPVFYWAWWTTWAPFVGAFIARISKGRTIREYVLGVLIVPSFVSFVWFSVLGGSALHLIHDLGITALGESVNADITSALFQFFEYLPLSTLLSVITMALIIIFFITSSDSATFVLGMLSDKGNLNPPNKLKVLWGVIIAGSAIVFLLNGGLDAVKTFSIVAAAPFTLLMIFMSYSIYKSVKGEMNETTIQTTQKDKSVS
ncbi:BCCT family transporter [Bacillus sp. 1P02SD]|uniref:BCCT family transporter n=1 Tax=Bacillus sp. 1P02SD TaxID=3132264 RepID=UPI0039A13BB2